MDKHSCISKPKRFQKSLNYQQGKLFHLVTKIFTGPAGNFSQDTVPLARVSDAGEYDSRKPLPTPPPHPTSSTPPPTSFTPLHPLLLLLPIHATSVRNLSVS